LRDLRDLSMKKTILRMGVIVTVLFIAACSNSDKKNSTSSTGTVTFFHYVNGSSTLSLESLGNDRGLGTVEFEDFGPGITLSAKTWDLTVTDIREETDASDDEIVLSDAEFAVTKNRRSIHALIGDYDLDTVELVNLAVAHDIEDGDDDNNEDGIADDKAQYINFSHIHSALTELDIYLVKPAQESTPLNLLEPITTIDFKQSSESIRLDENVTKYVLRVSLKDTDTEIYNSGERTLKDYIDQTIIIAPYTGAVDTGSQITAFYYGNGIDQKWLDSDSQGQVRVYNALLDSTDLDYILTSSETPGGVEISSILNFKDISSYEPINTSAVTYTVTPKDLIEGTAFFDGIGPAINVQDGESWTVIFFGRVAGLETSTAIKVLEEDNRFSNKATFTFSNVAYIADEEQRKPLNVHVKLQTEFLDVNSVDIPLLEYGDYGNINLNSGNRYEIWVTTENNLVVKAGPEIVDVEGGENFHFVLLENDGGGTPFQIVQLIGEVDAGRTTIDVDSDTTVADGSSSVEITVQARDRGANKLTSSAGTVILESTGDGVITPLTATDNNDGTYTATITNNTAQTVTISGTINAEDIVDTATVIFTAP
jgi:hypothetical protein